MISPKTAIDSIHQEFDASLECHQPVQETKPKPQQQARAIAASQQGPRPPQYIQSSAISGQMIKRGQTPKMADNSFQQFSSSLQQPHSRPNPLYPPRTSHQQVREDLVQSTQMSSTEQQLLFTSRNQQFMTNRTQIRNTMQQQSMTPNNLKSVISMVDTEQQWCGGSTKTTTQFDGSKASGGRTAKSQQRQHRGVSGSAGEDPEVWDMQGVTIPPQIKLSGKYEDNSIECVRRRLRRNMINHMKFNPALGGEQYNRYFKGVYQPENPVYVPESDEPKNFYACWAKYKTPDQINFVKKPNTLKPRHQKEANHPKTISEQQRQFLYEMKQLQPQQMFAVMKVLLEKMQKKEIQVREKSKAEVNEMIGELYKKVHKKNYDSLFHIFRAKIEQMLSEGYSVQPTNEEDRVQRQRFLEMLQQNDQKRAVGAQSCTIRSSQDRQTVAVSSEFFINQSGENPTASTKQASQKDLEMAAQMAGNSQVSVGSVVTQVKAQESIDEQRTGSSFSQRKAMQIKQEKAAARRPISIESKRQFISPDVDKAKLQSHRDQHWSKASRVRNSNLTLPVNRMTKSTKFQNQLAANKFHVSPSKQLVLKGRLQDQATKQVDAQGISSRQELIQDYDIVDIDLNQSNFSKRLSTKQGLEAVDVTEIDSEPEACDIRHPYYNVINDIVDYTKPVTQTRAPKQPKLKKLQTAQSIALSSQPSEDMPQTNSPRATGFKSSFGPHTLSPRTISKALKDKPQINPMNPLAPLVQAKIFQDSLLTDLCSVKKIDAENAEIAQSQLVYKDATESDKVHQHCQIITDIVADFMQYIDFNHPVKIKDLLRMASHQDKAEYEMFASPDVIKKFNNDNKILSKQISRQCAGNRIWQIENFTRTKYLRRLIAKSKCEKDDEPLIDFPLTLRPSCTEQVNPRWKEFN